VLHQADANRHPQPDPVAAPRVVRAEVRGQRPDQHGQHDSRIHVGRHDRVDAVSGPLMINAVKIHSAFG